VVGLTERVADFQTFTMSDLELVGQTGIEPLPPKEFLRLITRVDRATPKKSDWRVGLGNCAVATENFVGVASIEVAGILR